MVVCGGAGFLGSAITVALVRAGHDVTVIDGLMPESCGALANLDGAESLAANAAHPLQASIDADASRFPDLVRNLQAAHSREPYRQKFGVMIARVAAAGSSGTTAMCRCRGC